MVRQEPPAMGTQQAAESGQILAHTLRAEGFDASEDGTGRGTPIVIAEGGHRPECRDADKIGRADSPECGTVRDKPGPCAASPSAFALRGRAGGADGLPTGSEGETVERVVDRVLRTWYPHSAITETVAYAVRDALAGQGGGWEPEPDFRCVLPLPSWFTIDQKLDVEEAVRDAIYRVAPGKDIYVRAVLAAAPPEASEEPEDPTVREGEP